MGSVSVFLFFWTMGIIEILETLDEDYEILIDNQKVDFKEIKNYIQRLEKDILNLNEIVHIHIQNAAIDREKIRRLKNGKKI
ncbi:MAG: hypothetical protein MJZ37_00960 [Bacilli bacterium]|nr:hypothetical protein [Bacilli bacterium]